MEIFLEKENTTKILKLKKERKLKDILKELNISLESVILVKNNEITLEEENVKDSDKIKILSVVSGG